MGQMSVSEHAGPIVISGALNLQAAEREPAVRRAAWALLVFAAIPAACTIVPLLLNMPEFRSIVRIGAAVTSVFVGLSVGIWFGSLIAVWLTLAMVLGAGTFALVGTALTNPEYMTQAAVFWAIFASTFLAVLVPAHRALWARRARRSPRTADVHAAVTLPLPFPLPQRLAAPRN